MLDNTKLALVLLGMMQLPQEHTDETIAAANRRLIVEWGIEGKIICLVTDAGAVKI